MRRAAVTPGLLAGAALAQPAYRAAVRAMFAYNLRRLREGEPGPLLRTYADDIRFSFPGTSSWSADQMGRAGLEAWLRRFVAAGMKLHPIEVLVDGPPWNTRVCLLYHDDLTLPGGEVVYENRGAIVGWISWGKLKRYETHEDTHKVEAFDAWLAEHRPGL